MELTLQRRPLCFLRCVAQTLQYQEETGETVLPDNEPDLISVADCAAEVLLRGKDVRDGGVVVAGVQELSLSAHVRQAVDRAVEFLEGAS